MPIKKSPFFWEEMTRMDVTTLRDAFSECAKIDLEWAIDQAKCLSYQLAPRSAEASTTRQFCEQAARHAAFTGQPGLAAEALQIVAEDPAIVKGGSSAHIAPMMDLLKEILSTDREQALGLAIILNARTYKNTELRTALTGFLLDEAGNNQGIIFNIVRSGGACLRGEQLDRLLAKVGRLGFNDPYESLRLLNEMADHCRHLDDGQMDKLERMHKALRDSPEVMLSILEKEFGEDVTGLRRITELKPGQIMPAPTTMQ